MYMYADVLVFWQVGQKIFATFFAFGYVLPLSVIAVFSLCIVRHLAHLSASLGARVTWRTCVRHLAHVERSAASTLGAGKQKRHGADKKRHAGRMLVLVVVLFALLWLPIHIHLLTFFFVGQHPTGRAYMAATVLFSCLAYFNSCVNPIIYNHASKEFRDAFLEVARCGRGAGQQAADTAAVPGTGTGGGAMIVLAETSADTPRRHAQTTVTVTAC